MPFQTFSKRGLGDEQNELLTHSSCQPIQRLSIESGTTKPSPTLLRLNEKNKKLISTSQYKEYLFTPAQQLCDLFTNQHRVKGFGDDAGNLHLREAGAIAR